MTKEGEVRPKQKKKEKVSLWYYFGLFVGLSMVFTSLTLFGAPSFWSITTTEIFSIIFYSLMGVIVLMCCLSFPQESEETIERRRKARAKRREEEAAKRKEAIKARRRKQEIAKRKTAAETRQTRIEDARRRIEKHTKATAMSPARSAKSIGYPKRPIPGVTQAISDVKRDPPRKTSEGVEVRRGGEFIGNRMRFKVKVLNDSPYIITDVTVYLLSYPKDALKFTGEDHDSFFTKIEPGGFRSPTFDFLPTQDCVKGEIVAGVSYMDMRGDPHTLTAKPFVIRSVCDLLLPQQVTPEDFQLKLKELECGEIVIKIKEWTPEEMFEKALRIVDESNFFEVSSKTEETEGVFFGTIIGFAKGKYTGKEVGVEITITGPENVKGASCTIQVSGEDQAMILPAIDDLRERLSAWLCPMCSSPLTLANVEELRKGDVVTCPFCGVSIGR